MDTRKTLQYERFYEGTVHPHADMFPIMEWWHPKTTMLNLVWTHTGEWVKIPKNRGTQGGPNYFAYNVGRLERYHDEEGITKTTVAYGDDADKLTVWFHYEGMLKGLKDWILPETPFWWNNRK